MALKPINVFMASRFGEFRELRSALKARLVSRARGPRIFPVDLNDGAASHRPVLEECLRYVNDSEFMILILGDTYGELAPNSEKSYTHLEYEEAIKESSNTLVLVFLCGEHYRNGCIKTAEHPKLAEWQSQVTKNQTVKYIDVDASPTAQAEIIYFEFLASLYELSFDVQANNERDEIPAEWLETFDDELLSDNSETQRLDQQSGIDAVRTEDGVQARDAVMKPAAVAAREQREEAERAIRIRSYGDAIEHLRRALGHSPLDLMSNYRLAELFIALDRRRFAGEARSLAEKAARVASDAGLNYRAASAYCLAARAAQMAGRRDEALVYAQLAVEETEGKYARANAELARQHLLRGEQIEACKAAQNAVNRLPRIAVEMIRDSAFRNIRSEIDGYVRAYKEGLIRRAAVVLSVERAIATLCGEDSLEVDLQGKSTGQIVACARESARRQFQQLCNLARSTEPPKRPLPSRDRMYFSEPGRVRIAQWLKVPGDIVAPGDAILIYQTERSPNRRTWVFKGIKSVQMTARVGDSGTFVTSDEPYLFEYIPTDTPDKASVRVDELRKAIIQLEQPASAASPWQAALQNKLMTLRRTRDERASHSGGATSVEVRAIDEQIAQLMRQQSRYQDTVVAPNLHRDAQLVLLREALAALQPDYGRNQSLLCSAIDQFERMTLKDAWLVPWGNKLSRASVGDFVLVYRSSKKDEQRLVIDEDRPDWLKTHVEPAPVRLLKVIEITPQRIRLSAWAAYTRP